MNQLLENSNTKLTSNDWCMSDGNWCMSNKSWVVGVVSTGHISLRVSSVDRFAVWWKSVQGSLRKDKMTNVKNTWQRFKWSFLLGQFDQFELQLNGNLLRWLREKQQTKLRERWKFLQTLLITFGTCAITIWTESKLFESN